MSFRTDAEADRRMWFGELHDDERRELERERLDRLDEWAGVGERMDASAQNQQPAEEATPDA